MADEGKYIAEIECLTCGRKVVVEAEKDPYDGRYVIICPRSECGKLAYNSKTPPPKMENRL